MPPLDPPRQPAPGSTPQPRSTPPTEEEAIGRRDLAHWSTDVGRWLAATAVDAARRARPLADRFGVDLVAVLVTAAIGVVSLVLLEWGGGELYESVKEGDGLAALDQPVLDAAVSHRTPALSEGVTAFTDVGGPVIMPVVAVTVTLLLTWRWRRRTPIVLMATGTAGSLLMTVLGKDLAGRARPPRALAVPPFEESASFPSGHTLNATVIVALVVYLLLLRSTSLWSRVAVTLVGALFVLSMGLSRVFLGHHWLTDVVSGWLLGIGWVGVVVVGHRLALTIRRAVREHDSEPAT